LSRPTGLTPAAESFLKVARRYADHS
jgi:hypothetical protein